MHLSHTVSLALIGFSALGLTLPAHAQLTLTLDQPNQFYNTSAGTETLYFTGTIQNSTSDTQTIQDYALLSPYTASGQLLSNSLPGGVFNFGVEPSAFAPGASFSGILFAATLDRTTQPGVYAFGLGGSNLPDVPCTFEVQENDMATSAFFNVTQPYSITVTPAAVPEASTTVSFGLLLALGLGGVVIAKKKARAAA